MAIRISATGDQYIIDDTPGDLKVRYMLYSGYKLEYATFVRRDSQGVVDKQLAGIVVMSIDLKALKIWSNN